VESSGWGCTKFGALGQGAEELLVDALTKLMSRRALVPTMSDAYWLGTMGSGISGLTLSSR